MVTHNIEEAVTLADRVVVMEKEPERIVADLRITLPHPRQRKSPEFSALVDRVYATLAGQTQPAVMEVGVAPGEPGPRRSLPQSPLTIWPASSSSLSTTTAARSFICNPWRRRRRRCQEHE
jgi:NitT/TauT family transport system ATP-binding protein